MFKVIGPHKHYITPKHGAVDLDNLTEDKGFALCAEPSFPYLSITKDAIPALKGKKAAELVPLAKALPVEDLPILSEATKAKSVTEIIEKRIGATS